MTDFVEIPDDNSSDTDVQETHTTTPSHPALQQLRSLKSEMEFRGSLLGKTWTELTDIMTKYQTQLISTHEEIDSSITPADHATTTKNVRVEQEMKKFKSLNERLQKQVTELESKILEKDSEIVNLRTEVHKCRNEVTMKDNLIQKVQAQMAQEALDYQSEITALRDMLEAGQVYGANVGPVPVTPPIKRRRTTPKSQTPRARHDTQMYQSPLANNDAPHDSPLRLTPTSTPSTPVKSETFRASCSQQSDPPGHTTDDHNDQLLDSERPIQGADGQFFKVDEVFDGDLEGQVLEGEGLEGLIEGQDPNILLENLPGPEQALVRRPRHHGDRILSCPYCTKTFSRQADLNRHHREVHCGIKAYQCVICLRTFARSTKARSHVNVDHNRFGDVSELVKKII